MIFLRFIYLLLRIITWLGVTVFYRRRVILGREHLDFDGPAIIVVNHPSTLMDVLNSCLHVRQEPFFLANYSLFKNPVSNWILTRFFCIPVKRREDVAEGEARNNDAAFEKSFQHIEKKGILFVAAEGVSWMERWVRPFKTGVARIVLGAESRNNWELGVKIVPVGLSYSAPNLFRSEVIVHYGAPFTAESWANSNQQNHEQTVTDFTLEIEQQVRALVLDTRDAAGQTFIEQLETLMAPKFPARGKEYFAFRHNLITQNIDNADLRQQTSAYFSILEQEGVPETGMSWLTIPSSKMQTVFDAFLLLAGLPFFMLGFTFWWLPCFLPWLITKRMNLYIGYDSNVKMLVGLFTFPLALWGAFKVASVYLPGWWALAVPVMLVLLGYWTERYVDVVRRWRARSAAERLKQRNPSLFTDLLAQRAAIFEQIAG